MNIKQIENILKQGGIEPNEAKIEAKMLVMHFCRLSDKDLIFNSEFEENKELIISAKLRAEKRIPIQHIIGLAYFMGENFTVNENVLIPRDETEILVRKALEKINIKKEKGNKGLKVLDIGTGSGCIACMIAKLTDAQVLGIDISTEALQIALDNSSKLGLFNKAIFRKSNLFSNIRKEEKFDVIISNPPYIPICEKQYLQKEVQFEPELALFATDEKGIEFYKEIISQAKDYLTQDGVLLFELGINQSNQVKTLMEDYNFKDIEIIKDLAYIDRVIVGRIGD